MVLLLVGLAYSNRFIQDDAFISFRYAANLAEHGELDWNLGHPGRVEGYTNFLWTVMIAGGMAAGLAPTPVAHALGLFFFLGTCVLSYLIARCYLRAEPWAWIALLLLGTNYTFSAYATGGLETQLQAFLLVAGLYLAVPLLEGRGSSATRIALSTVMTLAVLNRLDALLPFGLIYAFCLGTSWWRSPATTSRVRAALQLLVLPLLLLGIYAAWKLSYYGALLPNTFLVKTGGEDAADLSQGLFYLKTFLKSYQLSLPLLALITGFWIKPDKRSSDWLLVSVLISWVLYVVLVGGDFMEWRFLVPILPVFFLLVTQGLMIIRPRVIGLGLILLVVSSSFIHGNTFEGAPGIESVENLERHLFAADSRWIEIGELLGELFPAETESVTIATTAAGAISYYSGLETVDMLGLNDRETALHGHHLEGKAGHRRFSRLSHMREQGVNLVLTNPRVLPPESISSGEDASQFQLMSFLHSDESADELPGSARLLEIPFDDGYLFLVLYLVSHPAIDRRIEQEAWITHP